MTLDYFYGQAGELFSFYRIPKALFQEPRFQSLSTDAKTLYGILLDRMSLSAKNGWLDEQGRVFIIFTIEDVKRALCCADNKATKLLRELEEFGLIERKRRGLGKPSLVYVKNFSAESSKSIFQNRDFHDSGGFKSASQDPAKSRCNKTDENNTEMSETYPLYSEEENGMSKREQLEEYFSQSLEVDTLLRLCPDDEDTIYQIIDLLVDTCATNRRMLRIANFAKSNAHVLWVVGVFLLLLLLVMSAFSSCSILFSGTTQVSGQTIYTAEDRDIKGAETDYKKLEKDLDKKIKRTPQDHPGYDEYTVTVTDEKTGALTPEGNLSLVDDYHTSYSDGSGQQFITLVSKSGNTFYLVIDRNAKGENTVHFMNLVDESDLLSLMEDEDAEAYTAENEAAAQAEQERKQAEEDAKKAEEEAAASGSEQPKENKITKYAATFLGVLALVGLAAGGGIYAFMKQKQKKKAEKEALDPDANYTEDKGDFEIPVEDEPEETGEEDNAEE